MAAAEENNRVAVISAREVTHENIICLDRFAD